MPVAAVRHPELQLSDCGSSPELEATGAGDKCSGGGRCEDDSGEADLPYYGARKRIYFNEAVFVQETRHINDMDDDEIDNTWLSNREYQQIKTSYSVTIKMMSTARGVPEHCEEHCARGLEYRTKDGSRRRQLNKLNALSAVLDEQERQRIHGVEDDETLSEVYMRFSEHCKETAHRHGVQDEEDADYGDLRSVYPANGGAAGGQASESNNRNRTRRAIKEILKSSSKERRQAVLDDIATVSAKRR